MQCANVFKLAGSYLPIINLIWKLLPTVKSQKLIKLIETNKMRHSVNWSENCNKRADLHFLEKFEFDVWVDFDSKESDFLSFFLWHRIKIWSADTDYTERRREKKKNKRSWGKKRNRERRYTGRKYVNWKAWLNILEGYYLEWLCH